MYSSLSIVNEITKIHDLDTWAIGHNLRKSVSLPRVLAGSAPAVAIDDYPMARGGWSLALIGNASETDLCVDGVLLRGVFDKETRRKPLARWTR
jgi:hypothetical protein